MNEDLELLLKCAEPLFYNRNAAVVLAVVRIYHRLAPASYSAKYVHPLLRLLQAGPEQQAVVLSTIATIAAERPVSHYKYLPIKTYDSTPIDAIRAAYAQVLHTSIAGHAGRTESQAAGPDTAREQGQRPNHPSRAYGLHPLAQCTLRIGSSAEHRKVRSTAIDCAGGVRKSLASANYARR